jgi:uncharacterized protein (TIGR00375 family)
MPLLADLHTHSKYAHACSHRLTLANMQAWCQIKGVDLLSTADFTHPEWFAQLEESLEEVAEGIYQMKTEYLAGAEIEVPESCRRDMHFILGTELNLIFERHNKKRQLHVLVYAPSFAVARQICQALAKWGNLSDDGRPIIGLDSEELMKILMDISQQIEVVPAHVWTPHFGIFGSRFGFDSLEECFGGMSEHIHALETGLSSDPAMNWRLSQHDHLAFVSNSDAHSPQKFGREATLYDIELKYSDFLKALREDHKKIAGTIEFFPEEGKYHCDGLRAEKLCLQPSETKEMGYVSPTGKHITVGVLHRVESLADRELGIAAPHARPVSHIIPLPEILSELLDVGVSSKKVQSRYFEVIEKLGPEFEILKDLSLDQIASEDDVLAEAIGRMRKKQVIIQPGYDGEYGVVRLFEKNELEKITSRKPAGQLELF